MKKTIQNLKSEKFICIAALVFSVVFLFWNIRDIMFTVHDDMRIYTVAKLGRLAEYAVHSAKSGRITHLWNTWLLGIPFLADSVIVYKIISFAALLFDALGFFILLKNHAGKNIAYVSVLLFFAISTLSPYHNLLAAYALCHQIPVGLMLFSLNFFLNSFMGRKKSNIAISTVLFLMSCMIYEAFIVFIVFFAVIAFVKNRCHKNNKLNVNNFLRDFLPYAVVSAAYTAIYFVWRIFYPTAYDGNQFYVHEPFLSLKTVYHYSVSFSPVFEFFDMVSKHQLGLHEFLSLLTIGSIFKAMLISVIFFKVMQKISLKCSDYVLLLMSFAGIFMPNIIVGFTEKYVNWERRGTYGYLTSFYSWFFLIVFVLTAVYMIYSRINGKTGRQIFMCFMTGAVCVSCIAADVTTDIWGNSYRELMVKYECFDAAVSGDFITNLNDGTDIYIPDNTGINGSMKYTEDYASIYSDKKISFHTDVKELDFEKRTVCMRYKSGYDLMVMAYVDEDFYADTLHIAAPDDKLHSLVMTLENGSTVIYENVKNGDIISCHNNIRFDLM